MYTKLNSIDNDYYYSNVSFIPTAQDNEPECTHTNPTRKETPMVDAFTTDDYGPQRWDYDGNKLEQTDDPDVWISKDGDIYGEDEVLSYKPVYVDNLGKKARTELNSSEESWLAAHIHEIEGEDTENKEDPNVRYAITKDTIYVTELEPKDKLSFLNQLGSKMLKWPLGIKDLVRKYENAEWMDEDLKSWALEFCTKDPGKVRWARVRCKKAKKVVMEFNGSQVIHLPGTIEAVPHFPRPSIYSYTMLWLPASRMPLALPAPKPEEPKKVHVDVYKPTKNMKEGFALAWFNTSNGKLHTKMYKLFQENGKDIKWGELIKDMTVLKEKGFIVDKKVCTGYYKAVRAKWNNPQEYIKERS